MEWINSKEQLPEDNSFVLCHSSESKRPFVAWHDGSQWVGNSNYMPRVDFWCEIPELPTE